MAIAFGNCRRTPATVSPGNVDNLSFLMASINVATGGEPKDPWCHACNSAADRCVYVLLAVCGSMYIAGLLLYLEIVDTIANV